MGNMLESAGIAEDLYEMMHRWMGSLRGGLAVGTVAICTILAACTGISGAAVVTTSLVALLPCSSEAIITPCRSCIAAGGALGILIPPSIPMIVYAFLSGESVGRLLLGCLSRTIIIRNVHVIHNSNMFSSSSTWSCATIRGIQSTFKEKLISLRAVILPIIVVVLVLGAIFTVQPRQPKHLQREH